MNDFTKDELEELESSLIFKMDRFIPIPEKRTHDLLDKIQSLIHIYCEHEWRYVIGNDGFAKNMKCRKCGEYKTR